MINLFFFTLLVLHSGIIQSISISPNIIKPVNGLRAPGMIPESILQIARITGIQVDTTDADNTLDDLITQTQKNWLRKPGSERWEIDQTKFESHAAELMPLFKRLGLLDQIDPKQTIYDYALLLGGSIDSAITRLNFLAELLQRSQGSRQKNIGLKKIIILTGQRQLTEQERAKLKELTSATSLTTIDALTETDMLRVLVDWKFKKAFAEPAQLFPIEFIDTPEKKLGGKSIRPTTGDTIIYWLAEHKPKPGSCLAISSQPFVLYQDLVLKTYLPASFTLETVGPKNSGTLSMGVYLDNLARYLYQKREYLRVHK